MIPGLIDAVVAIGSLVVPPAFDFIKKKFVKEENDTPERTMGSLATTKPEVLPEYVQALSELKDAEVKYFNRDVVGEPSGWVVDLRAAIRPIGVIVSFSILVCICIGWLDNIDGIRLSSEAVVSSWFGSRISLGR